MACGGVMIVSPYLQKAYPLGTFLFFVYLARMYLARVNETGQTARVLFPKAGAIHVWIRRGIFGVPGRHFIYAYRLIYRKLCLFTFGGCR